MDTPTTLDQGQVFALIGQQHVELLVLRERVSLLSQHRCAPCGNECCAPSDAPAEVPE